MHLVRRTFCKSIKELRPCANWPPKVARTNVLEWRTPEDRDEKAGSSCIKIPQLGRGDNDVQSPQLKGPMIQSARDGPWSPEGPRPASPCGPAQPLLAAVRVPFSSVLSRCNPNRRGKLPFARDAV
jgi:hypothetical protein